MPKESSLEWLMKFANEALFICSLLIFPTEMISCPWILPVWSLLFFCLSALSWLLRVTWLAVSGTATDTSMAGTPLMSWFTLPAMTLRCCYLHTMTLLWTALLRSRHHLTCPPEPASGGPENSSLISRRQSDSSFFALLGWALWAYLLLKCSSF